LLKWESIVIDPIGAMLAVVAFELILLGAEAPSGEIVGQAARFILGGLAVGFLVAVPTGQALRLHLIPERLVPLVGMTSALVAFAGADLIAAESGLLATTTLGMVLANSSRLRTESIVQFSEIIQTLLVGVLFILLSARLTRDQLGEISIGVVGLVVVLVLLARPLAVLVSSIGSALTKRERMLLAGVAPRGIVAAAVASVFALELEEIGLEGAEALTPVTFAVIVATVLLYGFGAKPLAIRLGLAERTNQGVLIVGAGRVELAVGNALNDVGIPVLFASTNRRDESSARMAGFRTYYGNLLDHEIPWDLDLSGIGRLMALTPNDEVNTLAARRFAELFDAAQCYQLPATPAGPGIEGTVADIGGRILFAPNLNYGEVAKRLRLGATVRRTTITDEFTVPDLAAELQDEGEVLFVVRGRQLLIRVANDQRNPLDRVQRGDVVVWLSGVPISVQ
jgi:CPA1 family monovalent cation:H+ antiporter